MSGHHPPLDCSQVKAALILLGFTQRPGKGSSHEQWVIACARGKFRKVTVDCPKAPFSQDLIKSMASQAGLTKKELYAAVDGKKPHDWPGPGCPLPAP